MKKISSSLFLRLEPFNFLLMKTIAFRVAILKEERTWNLSEIVKDTSVEGLTRDLEQMLANLQSAIDGYVMVEEILDKVGHL